MLTLAVRWGPCVRLIWHVGGTPGATSSKELCWVGCVQEILGPDAEDRLSEMPVAELGPHLWALQHRV
jgi:hypothetical protein